MGLSPVQSLRSFASNQPPLLVFTVCLMAFGITMVVLAYIIGENDFPNPDITMDWNVFMERFTELELCAQHSEVVINNKLPSIQTTTDLSLIRNDTNLTQPFVLLSSNAKTVDRSKSMGALLPDIAGQYDDDEITDNPINVTVSISVPLHLNMNTNNYPATILNMIVQGHQLGISGKAADEQLNVAVTLPEKHNLTHCQSEQKCEKYTNVCLTLRGSSHLLPQTKKPPTCQTNIHSHINEVKVSLKEKSKNDHGYWCRKGTIISLGYTPDSKLTVMLSYRDRSLVNLHLMHTSFFLFVMVMTLLCFALIRGRYRSPKNTISEKVPLEV